MGREERSLALSSGVRGGEGRRGMAPSPQVPPVVGPAVTAALTRLKFPVVVVAVGIAAAAVAAAPAAAAGTVAAAAAVSAGTVAFCVTWPAGLLPDQRARGQSWPQMRRQPQVHRARR